MYQIYSFTYTATECYTEKQLRSPISKANNIGKGNVRKGTYSIDHHSSALHILHEIYSIS